MIHPAGPATTRHNGLLPEPVTFTSREALSALAGEKVEHRVPLIYQPQHLAAHWVIGEFSGDLSSIYSPDGHKDSGSYMGLKSPFGKPGDRLYVRESVWTDRRESGVVIYDATPEWGKYRDTGKLVRSTFGDGNMPTREESRAAMLPKFWTRQLAATMPRWAARTLLEVERVWCQRLHEVDVLEALAEGVVGTHVVHGTMRESNGRVQTQDWDEGDPLEGFMAEWDAKNRRPEHKWAANPLVYGMAFRVVTSGLNDKGGQP